MWPGVDAWDANMNYVYMRAGEENRPHAHAESEDTIFILEGEMLMGKRRITPGTAMAIDGDTRYRVGVPDKGLAFLNFRTHSSIASMFEQGSKEPIDERKLWRVAPVL